MPTTQSRDGTSIYYESTGTGKPALVFVHGWIGNCRWWDQARDALKEEFQVAALDLGGHGKSGSDRKEHSVRAYAEDIKAVVEALRLERVILVGHSMSGSNVVEACNLMPERVEKIVMVDTLHDLDKMPSRETAAPLFAGLRADQRGTVENGFTQYLFTKDSPAAAVQTVVKAALEYPVEPAIAMLTPFYATDIRPAAAKVKVPVRAVQGSIQVTNEAANRKYFRDYSFEKIPGVGHYPMLENPEAFVAALRRALA